MPEQNESAAPAALEDTTAADEAAATDKVIDDVHADVLASDGPHDGVTDAELQAIRDKALKDDVLNEKEIARVQAAIDLSNEQARAEGEGMKSAATDDFEISSQRAEEERRSVISVGDTVYYGDGTGQVWPAVVTHVYDTSVPNGQVLGSANTQHVDLQVFKRKFVCDAENVAFHHFDPPRTLNGWIFKG